MDVPVDKAPIRAKLLELFEDTGNSLRWKVTQGRARVGDVPSGVNSEGYLRVSVGRKRLYVHRVLWVMRNGPIPVGMQVDHIDGDRRNNRADNLRLVSVSQNRCNARIRCDNSSGVKGVDWLSGKKRWRVRCQIYGKVVEVGYFKDLATAEEAAKEARRTMHREHANMGVHSSENMRCEGVDPTR